MNFNHTTLNETIQRILLGEDTLSFGDNEHINVVSENGMATTVQRMGEHLNRIEDLMKSCQLSGNYHKNKPIQKQFSTTMSTLNVTKEVMEWEATHCNLELYVVVMILDIMIVV